MNRNVAGERTLGNLERPPTEPQLRLIQKLRAERQVPRGVPRSLDREEADRQIQWLRSLPTKTDPGASWWLTPKVKDQRCRCGNKGSVAFCYLDKTWLCALCLDALGFTACESKAWRREQGRR